MEHVCELDQETCEIYRARNPESVTSEGGIPDARLSELRMSFEAVLAQCCQEG